MRCLSLALTLLILVALPASLDAKPPPASTVTPAQRQALERFIQRHYDNTQREDLDAYLADFIPNHIEEPQLRSFATRVFETYALEFTIDAINVLEIKGGWARVEVTLTTRFTDDDGQVLRHRALVKYHLRKVAAQWRIQHTERKRLDNDE